MGEKMPDYLLTGPMEMLRDLHWKSNWLESPPVSPFKEPVSLTPLHSPVGDLLPQEKPCHPLSVT